MDEKNGFVIMELFQEYSKKLQTVIQTVDWHPVEQLANEIKKAWRERKQVFFCGNGGSAGNAIHLANDFLYGVSMEKRTGIKAIALAANQSVLTCLANDISYEAIFSQQLSVLGGNRDILIVLSGSGNSPNIIKALEEAKTMEIKTAAILGYSGGKAKNLADIVIHFPVKDMQITEDMQLVVGHMLMRWLCKNPIDRL